MSGKRAKNIRRMIRRNGDKYKRKIIQEFFDNWMKTPHAISFYHARTFARIFLFLFLFSLFNIALLLGMLFYHKIVIFSNPLIWGLVGGWLIMIIYADWERRNLSYKEGTIKVALENDN